MTRTGVIAANVFREVIRDRALYLIGVFGLGLVVAAQLLPPVAAGTEGKMLLDLGLAAIGVLGLVIAIFVGATLINKEIEKRTVYVLIAKPVSKLEFIVGKHLGLTAMLAVLLAAMTIIYLAVLASQKVQIPLDSILLSVLFNLLELSLMTAIALLFGVFTSSLLATLLSFAVFLMGHFSRDLVTLGSLSKNPAVEQMTQALYLILPDLSRLNLKNEAVYGTNLLPPPGDLLSSAVYGVVYTVLVLTIAYLIFSRREF